MDLATSLAALPDKTWAQAVVGDSLQYWLNSRGETAISDGLEAQIAAVRAVLTVADAAYVQKLQVCLNLLDVQTHTLALQKSLEKQQRLETEVERRVQLALQQREQAEVERKAREAAERPAWATKAGKDDHGRYADLNVQGVTQRFRWIEAGTFLMGSPRFEPERSSGEVQHQVTLTKGYWLADTACTQALWQTVMGNNPAYFKDNTNNPVEQVSWDDVQGFLQALNQRVSGLTARLPTEAEWEYACRAGTITAFSCGDSITMQQANFGNNVGKTVSVISFAPNPWGLYQMHGNVWEWCQDGYGAYPTQAVADPQGAASGSSRVLRGG